MKYFTGEWNADSFIMYDIISRIQLYSDDRGKKRKEHPNRKPIFHRVNKHIKPITCKYGTTFRQKIGNDIRPYDPVNKGYFTKARIDNPELMDVFNEYRDLYFPGFIFTDITINYMPPGAMMAPHYDRTNVGDSILVGFGDYTGGDTFIQNEDDRNYTGWDIRRQTLKFNGAMRHHFVSSVSSGERYSLVFYNGKNKVYKKKKKNI